MARSSPLSLSTYYPACISSASSTSRSTRNRFGIPSTSFVDQTSNDAHNCQAPYCSNYYASRETANDCLRWEDCSVCRECFYSLPPRAMWTNKELEACPGSFRWNT